MQFGGSRHVEPSRKPRKTRLTCLFISSASCIVQQEASVAVLQNSPSVAQGLWARA